MSEQEIKNEQPVQLTEDELDDVQGGLLPAVKMQKVNEAASPATTKGIIAVSPSAVAGDGSV